jgi:hypothetical protein
MNRILENIYPDKNVLASRQADPLPCLPGGFDPFTEYLHEEMRQCYLNGHDHAALVTACALLESAVKVAIYVVELAKCGYVDNPDEWDKIDSLEFGPAVNRAKAQGLVTKEEWKKLEYMREFIRNPYMHGQTPDWVKDQDYEVMVGDLETGAVAEDSLRGRRDPGIQRVIRICADRNVCDWFVRFVDGCVRTLVARSRSLLDEQKKANPFNATPEQIERVGRRMQELGACLILTNDHPEVDG